MNNEDETPYRQTLAELERMMDPTDAIEFWANLGKTKTKTIREQDRAEGQEEHGQ